MTPSELGRVAPHALSPLDVATAMALGVVATARPALSSPAGHPGAALRLVVADALRAGEPVFVTFSGGRDSSTILAVAADLARREGHVLPIPVTIRSTGLAEADEGEWQDLVLAHLGLSERIFVDLDDSHGLLGSVATDLLLRHGLLWPPNVYLHRAMATACGPGVMLTGAGGDEIFHESPPSPTREVLLGRRRPRPRDVTRIAAALMAPKAYDRRRARFGPTLPWLTESANRSMRAGLVAEEGLPHHGWNRGAERFHQSNVVAALRTASRVIGADLDLRILHPFHDPRFVASIAEVGGFAGLGSRAAAMEMLVGDLLPPAVIHRETKASFGGVLWTEQTLARSRSNDLLDAIASDVELRPLIDLSGLQRTLSAPSPHYMASLLVQGAWLSSADQTQDRG